MGSHFQGWLIMTHQSLYVRDHAKIEPYTANKPFKED